MSIFLAYFKGLIHSTDMNTYVCTGDIFQNTTEYTPQKICHFLYKIMRNARCEQIKKYQLKKNNNYINLNLSGNYFETKTVK